MIVIAIANSKGGVGKTTLTTALAVRAAQDSKRVCMVDLDPQCSLSEWWARRGKRDNPTCFVGVDSAIEAVERAEMDGWDWCFLDGPPAFLETVKEMIEAADLSVIPVKSGLVDLLATQDAVALARDAGAAFLCVFNDVEPPRAGGKPDRLAEKARSYLFSSDVPIADAQIAHRVSHVDGMNLGKSAAETKDKIAAAEIDALWLEVKEKAKASAKKRAKKAAGNV